MKIDLNRYSVNRPFIQKWYRDSDNKDISNAVSILSPATHTPCIAMCFFLAEQEGFSPEMVFLIDTLIRFYGYKQILNQPEGSPYMEKYS